MNDSPGDKSSRLVEAATEVFALKGYASTRVADIAERAEIGKGTVYEYFSSKEELLFAVFESISKGISKRMDAALAEGGSTKDQLRRLLKIGAEVAAEQIDLQPVILDFWAASRGKGIEKRYREAVVVSYRFYREMIVDFIHAGQARGEFVDDVDLEALATTIVAAIDGLGVQLYFDRSIDPTRVTDALGKLLLKSLQMESS